MAFTPEQWKTITDKITEVVGEHATAFVIIAQIPVGEDEHVPTFTNWRGGCDLAFGMCERAKMRINEVARRNDFPDTIPGSAQ